MYMECIAYLGKPFLLHKYKNVSVFSTVTIPSFY